VREGVVVVREIGQSGDKRLVGYIVPDKMPGPEVADVRDYLRRMLPEYMVPSAIVVVEALPLTPSGKIDRQALPAVGMGTERVYVPPRTDIEAEVAAICAQLLGIERVGAEDNFFDLGGHSLLATQLMARVRDRWQVELPLRALFESPTVAGLAKRIEEGRKTMSTDLETIAAALAAVSNLPDDQVREMMSKNATS
jgi:acyl carrier protein